MWKLTGWQRLASLSLFIKQVGNVETLRQMFAAKGDRFPLFGGTAYCRHADVKALMEREPTKATGFCAPLEEVGVFFSANYMPFLQKGPNHTQRREHVLTAARAAHKNLGELDALLAAGKEPEEALARFLFKNIAGIELTPEELQDIYFFRKWAAPLGVLPKAVSKTLFGAKRRKLAKIRAHFEQRFSAAGLPYADTYMDVLWFNSGTLGFYPQRAIEALQKNPQLMAVLAPEVDLPPAQRQKTRALVMEMLRLHARIASVNYLENNEIKIAVIPCANIDPQRYERPREIDLGRDHADSVWFATPSPQRSCPGQNLAPDAMACIVAHHVKTSWRAPG